MKRIDQSHHRSRLSLSFDHIFKREKASRKGGFLFGDLRKEPSDSALRSAAGGAVILLVEPFGTLLHEEDLDGHEDEPDVGSQAVVLDVEEVEFQFVVRRRVVLAVDLGVTGEAGLDLEAVGELGELFRVFFDVFRRSGSSNGT